MTKRPENPSSAAALVMDRINALGQISDESGRLTRTFCSPAMRRANDLVASWMRETGMSVREDAIGNVVGHYAGRNPEAKTLLLGSHLDTVRDAGKFDGPLGVLIAIACVDHLRATHTRLSFAIEVAGFCDEEGVRYQNTYLGSKVIAGTFNAKDLALTDAEGISMADAIRKFGGKPEALGSSRFDPNKLLGYAEVHIEQGPVLEQKKLAVGIVSAIAAQTRMRFNFIGRAGHAGTVPMSLRQDALCAAAEFVLAVEGYAKKEEGLVATVGELTALPGASNVIVGEVRLSLDIRHATDSIRRIACADLTRQAAVIGAARKVEMKWEISHEAPAVACDSRLISVPQRAVQRHQPQAVFLTSGAGHDAGAMAATTPVAMLFVRCQDGISHHPDESATVDDIKVAIEVMNDFLELLAEERA